MNQTGKTHVKQGIDAPLVPILYLITGVGVLINWAMAHAYPTAWVTLIFGIVMFAGGLTFFHTSLRGKYTIWRGIMDKLTIPKNAQVLDLGCGHGAVMIAFAKRLGVTGHATGIDLWQQRDQSNNGVAQTQANLVAENVADRTTVLTGDMTKLPTNNAAFDFVVSSFAFHNIKPKEHRAVALSEAVRTLKPGGRLIIVDTEHNDREYRMALQDLGLKDIEVKSAGFNGWWSGPWMSSYIVQGVKAE
ncbi:MAG TPA: SAM-dependent methyltransferase [Lactobacillus sp.]|nr:SAM-dependent methyltransferase [Lactobacillus sp.]